MRKSLGLLGLLVILGTSQAAQGAQVATVRGSAALLAFHAVSADGCLVTTGELAVLQARTTSELADGVYAVGVQEDVCAGTGNGFAGYGLGQLRIAGLASAHFTGTLVAPSYSGGAPVTLELDLGWTGQGAVTRQRSRFRDGGAIEFSYSSQRSASTSGSFTVDGVAAEVSSARLGGETSGHVTF